MRIGRQLTFGAAIMLVISLAGCGKEEPAPGAQGGNPEAKREEQKEAEKQRTKKPGRNPLSAPGDYLKETTVTAPRHIKQEAALAQMKTALKRFEAMKGRHAKSLDELKEWRGVEHPKLPPGKKYNYDPKTGKIDVVEKR